MTLRVAYWDNDLKMQMERDMTPEEEVQHWIDVALSQIPKVPEKVNRRQARQALFLAGKLEEIEAALAAIPDPIMRGMAIIEWEDSLEFERSRPLVVSIGTAIGMTEEDINQLFIQAGKL